MYFDVDKCSGCELCVPACPFGAIRIEAGKAAISEQCTLCGACLETCPSGALTLPLPVSAPDSPDDHRGVWVVGELRKGKVVDVVYELLGEGRKLADKLGEELCAVLIGSDGDRAGELIAHGADRVYLVAHPRLEKFQDELYAGVLTTLVQKYRPGIVLLGATINGRSLAPRVATRLKTGLTADCTELDIDPDRKLLLQTRPAFGGNIMATIICQYRRPQMATVRPKVFPKAAAHRGQPGVVIPVAMDISSLPERTRITGAVENPPDMVNLDEADIIVSGGRGLGEAKNFRLVEELAHLLGGAVGASRAAVDEGWAPYACQVGQTGKTVGPKLYIACGISGAVQHQIGMRSASTIIAINKNPEAPIFGLADYGIVGDVVAVLAELIAGIKQSQR